jgi:hypothetical protein
MYVVSDESLKEARKVAEHIAGRELDYNWTHKEGEKWIEFYGD